MKDWLITLGIEHPHLLLAAVIISFAVAAVLLAAGGMQVDRWLQDRRGDAEAVDGFDDDAPGPETGSREGYSSTLRSAEWTDADDLALMAFIGLGPDGTQL